MTDSVRRFWREGHAPERLWVMLGLAGAVIVTWAWIAPMALDMYGSMDGAAAWMMVGEWSAAYFLLMFAMWVAMMVGMMLPSATPAILLFTRVVQSTPVPEQPRLRPALFTAGYLLAWAGFSLVATALQWQLSTAQLLTPMMESGSRLFSAAVLITAGAWQWSPLKATCLTQCRAPMDYLARHWRKGRLGALRMGIGHGLYCVGCCWALMLLLFVGGVMSLLWIGLITAFVLLEKLAPFGAQGGRLSGVLLVGAGVLLAVMP